MVILTLTRMGERALQIRDHLWSGLPNSRSNTPLNGKNPRRTRRRFGLKDVKDKILEQLTANTDVRLPSKVWTKYGLRATRFDRIVSDTVWLPCDIPFWQSDFEFQRIQTGDEAQRMFSDLVHLNAMLHALRTVNLPSNQFRGRTYIEQDNI